jgi:hypothetical protein
MRSSAAINSVDASSAANGAAIILVSMNKRIKPSRRVAKIL